MLKIYIGNCYSHKLASLDVTYAWPEEMRSPWEQLDWFDNHLKLFQTKDISIKTFSPYILNYINLKLMKDELDYDNLEVWEINYDEETDSYDIYDLKILNEKLIDARSLSDPITYIYDEYRKAKIEKNT